MVAVSVLIAYVVHRYRKSVRQTAEGRQQTIERYLTVAREKATSAPSPDHLRRETLEIMRRICAMDDPWESLLRLGTVYKYGQHGVFGPNTDAAAACFRCALFTSSDPEIRSRARTQLFSPDVDDVDIERDVPSIPFDMAQAAIRRAQTIAGPNRISEKPRRVVEDIPANVVIPSDTQNAHDHGVSSSVRKTLSCLQDPMTDHRPDVLAHIASEECRVSDDAKASAVYAIDSLRTTVDSPYTGMSEVDALSRVWRAAEERDNVVLQLAGCVEDGKPVCHSGKIARLVSSLETSVPIAVPTWAIRQQLYALASKVRRDHLENLDPDAVSLYERGMHPVLTESMGASFKRKVDELDHAIDPAMLRSMVDDVVEAF